jgi:DNA-binding response OmpR family regulator
MVQPERSPTALVVESDDVLRELLHVHLVNAGYRVMLAADALVAGRTLLKMAGELHVLVVDAELPYLSGVEFIATLMADTTLPYIPVVMIGRDEQVTQRAELLGIRSVTMPLSAEKLITTIQDSIDRTMPRREGAAGKPEARMQTWLDRSERRATQRDGTGGAAATRSPARRLRLVIADDEPDTVASLMAILCDEGHSVFGAHRGGEVLSTVRLERPDAVLLDIDMPGISGYAVARAIREMFADSPACPLLVAISGKWVGKTDQMLAELSGFHHFLRKPCEPSRLLELLAPLTETPRTGLVATRPEAPGNDILAA